jgi:Putative porin
MFGNRKLNHLAVVLSIVLAFLMPSAVMQAGDGTASEPERSSAESRPGGTISTPAESQPNASAVTLLAPLLLELQQLKETVEGQSARIAKQSQELDSERASIRDELDRISKLEAELKTPKDKAETFVALAQPAQPVSASGSSSVVGTAASAAPIPVVQQQAPPAQGSVDRRLGELEQRLKKLGPLSFSGDFRLREDAFFGGPSDRSLDQNLQNYRLRFNVDVQLSNDLSGGFTLASGNINDPTSTNQTLTGFYARKPIALDKVFIKYHPSYFKPLSLIAGKFAYPWYNTELTWDKDLNPEGFGQTLNFDLNSTPVLKRIAMIGFELPFSQVAGTSLSNKSLMQTAVYGGQFQTEWRLADWLELTAYTGFYNFHNADPMALALARASAKNPATPLIGLLPLAGGGGAVQNSVTTTSATSVVSVNGTPEPTGVTSIANAQFASKFGLFDSIARFDVKTPSERWPVAIIGDYVQNTEACANGRNILPAPVNTATTEYTRSVNFSCDPRQRRGYWGEVEVGRILEKHDLQFGYTRIFIEREAVLSNLNYNQMYQGSNVTEHRFSVFYTVRSNVILDFIGLFGRPLNFGGATPPIDSLKRLQFDVNYVF